jgi:hypothetical protein
MMIIMSSRFRFRSGGCSEGGLFVDGENVAPIWARWTNDFFIFFSVSLGGELRLLDGLYYSLIGKFMYLVVLKM